MLNIVWNFIRNRKEVRLRTLEERLEFYKGQAAAAKLEIKEGVCPDENFLKINIGVIGNYNKAQDELLPRISKLRKELGL